MAQNTPSPYGETDPEATALMERSDQREETCPECSTSKHSSLSECSAIRKRLNILLGLCFICFIMLEFIVFDKYSSVSHSLHETAATATAPTWLIATMSPVHGTSRRQIIRSTWQKHVTKHPHIQCVFFLGQPSPIWDPVIQAENTTYGDIITLSIEDTNYIANHYKAIEFLKYLRDAFPSPSWKFVTKIDDDSYLASTEFYNRYLLPNWNDENLIIGRDMLRGWHTKDWQYPGGQMYTLSYPLAMHLADLHDANPVRDEDEDALIGRLPYEANETFDFVSMSNIDAFDVTESDDITAWGHRVSEGAINPHKMKLDDEYLQVAALFGDDGVVNMMRVNEAYGTAS